MFSIDNIAFTLLGYPLSYIELFGTLSGFISVYLATKTNIWTWPTGILNELAFFILFYQVQLYADMFLQVYFYVITVYGWCVWGNQKEEVKITRLNKKGLSLYGILLLTGTVCLWLFIKNIHLYFPDYFVQKAAFPFADSFVTIGSVLATILLAKKKVETWVLWILVDVVSIGLYFMKGIQFVAIEYVLFLGMAIAGLFGWKAKLHHSNTPELQNS